MKVLIVTDAWKPQVNGVVFTLGQTCHELRQMGHEVQVIQPGLFRSVPCPSYPEIRLSLPLPGTVAKLIRQYGPDAVHIATEGPLGLAARRYMRRKGLPFTTAYHTRFPEYVYARTRLPQSLTYRWLRWFHGKAARTMVPTAGVRHDLLANGFSAEKVVVWARGVDVDMFQPQAPGGTADSQASDGNDQGSGIGSEMAASAIMAAHADIPAGKRPVFLYTGRVAIEKNLDAFLRLDLPGEKWVVGGGPALETMKSRYPDARYFGAQPHDELAKFYRAADVFVFPSLTDTFGLVLLEAMACGCPVASLPAQSTIDVLAQSGAGVVSEDLRQACLDALNIPRHIPAAYAQGFSWAATTQVFFSYLQPMGEDSGPLEPAAAGA